MTPTLLNNRYRILETLGSGGFGNTFLAEDSYLPSGRKCVIKQLKPVTHNPQAYKLVQERFQREAAVLEELGEGHSQIPRLYAYFSEDERFYLVQEWIEGNTLTEKVQKQGVLDQTEVKEILTSLLSTLIYVHNRRIVHRDIKPDNIIIRQRDQLPVLIDFGAVKEAISTVINSQGNSTASMVIGTPGFMSGEQAAGRPIYASDLYSLGLTAIFLLAGKLPQQLETDTSTGEILWRQQVTGIHSQLATVIDKAIRFHPGDRFTTAREMLQALKSSTSVSEMDTVAVSPGILPKTGNSSNSPARSPNSDTTVPVGNNTPKQGNSPLIMGASIAGGVLVAAVAVGLTLGRSPQVSEPVASSETPVETTPVETTPVETTPVEQAPSARSSDSDPPSTEVVHKTEVPQKQVPSNSLPSSQPSTKPETSVPSLPQIFPKPEAPKPEIEEVAASSPPAKSPVPEPVIESEPVVPPKPILVPKPAPENNNQNYDISKPIPAFAPGTQKRAVEDILGDPTKSSKGLWNTRALLYEDYIPGQVSLGYLFDKSSGRLRQTEVTFSQSVGLETMSQTLEKMMSDNATAEIKQELEAIYQRQSNRYTFKGGRENRLQGVFERNKYDRIYIGIWEADLK
ncbi:MAG: protein kinase [Symploca sp. SIO1C4]|uniref:non-specific serine/threonine protein kinase n=1 Tax=Symploca sp. SIO1C4 TaxID=2607765 RepID=A0A6B3NBN9_9CYAN|nr:protein kinase [Symploca sp. SIO1C4]